VPVTVRLYDRLFKVEDPEADKNIDFLHQLNPESKVVVDNAMAEPCILEMQPGDTIQFERLGYFCADSVESKIGHPIFNRTVTLKDSWESQTK
jgi:glutaminyl-tRNA synthetase